MFPACPYTTKASKQNTVQPTHANSAHIRICSVSQSPARQSISQPAFQPSIFSAPPHDKIHLKNKLTNTYIGNTSNFPSQSIALSSYLQLIL